MKKRTLFSSIVVLVLCAGLIAGSTFALFTSEYKNKIAVTSGKVEITAETNNLKTYSMGVEQTEGVFENGGSATLKDGVLTLDKLTPGDKVSFDLVWENKSNIAIVWNAAVTAEAKEGLAKALVVTVEGVEAAQTGWKKLAAGAAVPAEDATVSITLELPAEVGNEYQEETASYAVTLTAVQGNSTSFSYTKGVNQAPAVAFGDKANDQALRVSGEGTVLNVTNSLVDGGNGGNNVGVYATQKATVNISGGEFTVGADASGAGNSVIEADYGATVNISGGFFYTDYAFNGIYYVLNQNNKNPGTFVVKGGTFVNYNPATGDDVLGGNFVAEGYTVVSEAQANGDVWYTVIPDAAKVAEAKAAFAAGGNVTINSDVVNVDESAASALVINGNATVEFGDNVCYLDLPNATSATANWKGLDIKSGTVTLNGTTGGIVTAANGELYAVAVGVKDGTSADVTINGGTYVGGTTAINVVNGTCTITGGFFQTADPKWTLNCIDGPYKAGKANIIVKGGTFVNFNPADNKAEGEGTNFVAEGYKVVEQVQANGDVWYTVVAE